MKIVIAGAGISGLSTYLFLRKLLPSDFPLDILIYEKHPPTSSDNPSANNSPVSAGGALGIAPNGLTVLRALSEDLYQKVISLGHACTNYAIKNAKGWNLGTFRATSYDDPPLPSILISRQKFWECLRRMVPDEAIVYTTIVRVSDVDSNQPTVHHSASPDPEKADLIVGADGVHSIVKKAVTGNGNYDDLPPQYEGLVGIGSFVPTSLLSSSFSSGTMTMTFGRNGFFGYGPCTSSSSETSGSATKTVSQGPTSFWWSTYSLSTPPASTSSISKTDIISQLCSRHENWADPAISSIIAHVSEGEGKGKDTISSLLPTYTTPDLPTWSRGNVILVGDAAHAMQPSSGQGASMALEDVQVLCMLLEHYLPHNIPSSIAGKGNKEREASLTSAIRQTLQQYEHMRRPRVHKVVERGRQFADKKRTMSMLEEWIMYAAMWAMTRFAGEGWNKTLYAEVPEKEVKKFVGKEKGREASKEETGAKQMGQERREEGGPWEQGK